MPDPRFERPLSLYENLQWDDQEEVTYWAELFGITPTALQEAIMEVGPSAKSIAVHLQIIPNLPRDVERLGRS